MYRKINGFTIIELLIVMAIMGVLLGFTFTSLQGLGQKSGLKQSANNLLAAVESARNDALNARTQNITDSFIYGYVLSFQFGSIPHQYCIYSWNAPSGDPTSVSFKVPMTLSQMIATNSISLDPASVPCNPSLAVASPSYTLIDNKALDNRTDYSYYLRDSTQGCGVDASAPQYFVFETISGNLYAFDSNGKYLPGSSSIQICDSHGNTNSVYLNMIVGNVNQPPYVQ